MPRRGGPAPGRGGFTLVEILIAMMLTGMVTALALAPVVMTVRRVVDLKQDYSDACALSRTLSFIGREAAGALRLARTSLIVEDGRILGGGDNDTLIVMSAAPARQQQAAGSLVYRLVRGGVMLNDVPEGLYRWALPCKFPEDVDLKKLRPEEGQLVLPGATAFRVEVPVGEAELEKEYKGPLPTGLLLALTRGEGERAETFEDIVVFP